jgi:hypothetical protein
MHASYTYVRSVFKTAGKSIVPTALFHIFPQFLYWTTEIYAKITSVLFISLPYEYSAYT